MQNAQSLILLASGEDRLIGFNGKTIENTYIDGTSFAAPKIANIAINSILTQGSSVPDLLSQLRTKSELVTHNYGKDIRILPNYNVLQTSFTYSEAIKIAPNVNFSTTNILEIKVELVPNQQPLNIFTNYLFSVLDSPKGPWNLDESIDNTFQIPGGRASYYYYYSNFPIQMKILKTDGTIEYIPITVQQIIDAGLYQIFQYPQSSTASIKIAELTEVSAFLVDVTTPTAIPTMFSTSTPTITSTPTPAQLPTSTPTPTPTPTKYNLLYFLPTIIYNKN